MRLFHAIATVAAALFSRQAVAVEQATCNHGGTQLNHKVPHTMYFNSGADMCLPMIDIARRKNRRAKEMVRHDEAWRAKR